MSKTEANGGLCVARRTGMTRTSEPVLRPVHRSLNRPLRVCGVDRQLFFLAIGLGTAVFNLFHTLLGGLLMWALLYAFGLWATARDPDLLRILLSGAHTRRRFDPIKRGVVVPARLRRRSGAALKTIGDPRVEEDAGGPA
jgi:type IV secretory pathway TrbD component